MASHEAAMMVGSYHVHFTTFETPQSELTPKNTEALVLLHQMKSILENPPDEAELLSQMTKPEEARTKRQRRLFAENNNLIRGVKNKKSPHVRYFWAQFINTLSYAQALLHRRQKSVVRRQILVYKQLEGVLPYAEERTQWYQSGMGMTIRHCSDLPWAVNTKLGGTILDLPTFRPLDQFFLFSWGTSGFCALCQEYRRFAGRYIIHVSQPGHFWESGDKPFYATVKMQKLHDAAAIADSHYKVAVSVLAQFRNLQKRFGADVDLPPLLAVFSFDHFWIFYVAELQDDSTLIFWRAKEINLSTTRAEDLMKIMQTFKVIDLWAGEFFEKWWTEKIERYLATMTMESAARQRVYWSSLDQMVELWIESGLAF